MTIEDYLSVITRNFTSEFNDINVNNYPSEDNIARFIVTIEHLEFPIEIISLEANIVRWFYFQNPLDLDSDKIVRVSTLRELPFAVQRVYDNYMVSLGCVKLNEIN